MKTLKYHLFCLLVILFASQAFAQHTHNPFAEYGYDTPVLTLSNGKYQEFHDLETVVTIGTVRYNTLTKEVVELLPDNYKEDTTANPKSELTTRFLSIDPLTKEFPMLTPYQFASNRPIEAIDLDGLESFSSKGLQQNGKAFFGPLSSEFIDKNKLQRTDEVHNNPAPAPSPSSNNQGDESNLAQQASGYGPLSAYSGLTRLAYASEVFSLYFRYGGNSQDKSIANIPGNKARYDLKLKYRNFAIPGTEKVLDIVEPLEMKTTQASYYKTRWTVNAMGGLGLASGAYGIYNGYKNIESSDNKGAAIAEEGGGFLGAWVAMKAAAPFAAQSGNAFTALGILGMSGLAGGIGGKAAVQGMNSGGKGSLFPFKDSSSPMAPADNTKAGSGTGF